MDNVKNYRQYTLRFTVGIPAGSLRRNDVALTVMRSTHRIDVNTTSRQRCACWEQNSSYKFYVAKGLALREKYHILKGEKMENCLEIKQFSSVKIKVLL